MPKVSIITGFFNRGDKVERTLDSLCSQIFEDYEIVVFNDASTDDTRVRLEAYARAHPAAPLVIRNHSQNIGFVRGMMAAVAETESDYVAVHGSGDTAHPDRLRQQAEVLDNEPGVVAVGCWYHSVTEASGERQLRKPNADTVTFDKLVDGRPPFTHGEVMFRRAAYVAAGGYRAAFTYSQDYDLWLRMIRLGSFRTVPIALYDRYTLSDGVSYTPHKRLMQLRYSILARKLARCPEQEVAPLLAELEEEGPENLVPLEHPYLQKQMFKSAIASIAWQNIEAAEEIEREFLTKKSLKWVIRTGLRYCNNSASRYLLRQAAARG